jgi:NADH-quinone oxidoreductase subunit L
MDEETRHHLHESPAVVTIPLILLAIPSLVIGWITVKPVLFGGYFAGAIKVLPANDVLARIGEEFHSPGVFLGGAFDGAPIYLLAAGAITAWLFFYKFPGWADASERRFKWLHFILINKYGFDWLNQQVFVRIARGLGTAFWKGGDELLIDGALVNGSARIVGWLGSVVRYAQSGYLYHYAFAMILGLASLLLWLIWRP